MTVGRKMQDIVVVFYRKVHTFQMMINVSKTSHISYKMVSTEYYKVGNVLRKHISCF